MRRLLVGAEAAKVALSVDASISISTPSCGRLEMRAEQLAAVSAPLLRRLGPPLSRVAAETFLSWSAWCVVSTATAGINLASMLGEACYAVYRSKCKTAAALEVTGSAHRVECAQRPEPFSAPCVGQTCSSRGALPAAAVSASLRSPSTGLHRRRGGFQRSFWLVVRGRVVITGGQQLGCAWKDLRMQWPGHGATAWGVDEGARYNCRIAWG